MKMGSNFPIFNRSNQEKEREAQLEREAKAIETYFDRLMGSLLKQPQCQDNSLQRHIREIVYQGFSEDDIEKIKQELECWKEFPIDSLIHGEYDHKLIDLYTKSAVLSARVFHRVSELIYSSRYSKPDQNCEFELKKQFGEFLRNEEINLSHNRYFFEKARRFRYQDEDQIQGEVNEAEFALKVRQWAQHHQKKDETIKKMLQFLQKIGLLVYENKKETSNTFMIMLQRITKQDQRKLFLLNYRHPNLEQLLQNTKEDHSSLYPNYHFYKNKGRICRSEFTITQLQGQIYNYGFLEGSHDYIQWMFPNHYGSAFNSRSKPLDYTESQLFHRDLEIGARLLRSIYVFLDFMGLRFDPRTLEMKVCSMKRFKEVIMVNYHNHLRIMRILACLSVTGFRKVALNLIDILDEYTQKGKPFEKERREFEKSWNIYGQGSLQKAKAMCFLETEDFPSDHPIIKLAADLQIVIESKAIDQKEEEIDIEIPNTKKQQDQQLIEVEDFDAPSKKNTEKIETQPQVGQQQEQIQADQPQPEQSNQQATPPEAPLPQTEKPDSPIDEEKPATAVLLAQQHQEKPSLPNSEQNPSYIVPPCHPIPDDS